MYQNVYKYLINRALSHALIARLSFKILHQVIDRFRKPPILIYQMGKVGSAAIKESLSQYIWGRSIFHIHNLNKSQAETELKWHLKKSGSTRRYDGLWNSLYLSQRVAQTNQEKWPIITLVRDPVGRNISGFFQVMDRSNPELLKEVIIEEQLTQLVLQNFLDDTTQHSIPENWFDDHLKTVFGIDVYSTPFPREKGYSIFENERAKVLLIRLEDLNRCATDAFKEFLGIENFTLLPANIGSEKPYKKIYKTFLENLSLPYSYLDSMYNSKFSRHFYSQEEICIFRKKWLGKASQNHITTN